MAKGNLLGHIDCPSCGSVGGMRITEDKNGNPFGFCEANCDQQLRVGGSLSRVEKFYATHPGIKRQDSAPSVSVQKKQEPKKPVTVTVPASVKQKPHWTEILGVPKPESEGVE